MHFSRSAWGDCGYYVLLETMPRQNTRANACAPRWSRTTSLSIKSALLYPFELWKHVCHGQRMTALQCSSSVSSSPGNHTSSPSYDTHDVSLLAGMNPFPSWSRDNNTMSSGLHDYSISIMRLTVTYSRLFIPCLSLSIISPSHDPGRGRTCISLIKSQVRYHSRHEAPHEPGPTMSRLLSSALFSRPTALSFITCHFVPLYM